MLDELYPGRRSAIESTHAQLAELMADEGLPFTPAMRVPNTRLAQELAAWGMRAGNKKIGDALYRAHFAEGKDIGDPSTLVALAAAVGLDPDRAAEVLGTRSHRGQIDQEWQRSSDLDLTGVPTFMIGDEDLFGAQSYETLESFVLRAGARPRAAGTSD